MMIALTLCALLNPPMAAVTQSETSHECLVDLDRDGRLERIVRRPLARIRGVRSGTVTVLASDGRTLFTLAGDSNGDRFGWSAEVAGDVDGDGVLDIVVGAPLDDPAGNGSGSAYVFSGKDGTRLRSMQGTAAGQQFGYSVAGAGDVNGDGFADVIVGAPFADRRHRNVGFIRIFSGKDGSILRTVWGTEPHERLGRIVGRCDVEKISGRQGER